MSNVMDFSKIDARSFKGKLLRLPLKLLSPEMIVPIMSGKLRGKKWIVGSSIHGCWLGTYEYKQQITFSKIITPQSVVFDIGGNVGFYTLLASVLVGKNGRVFVFEPLPRNLIYLKKHLEINNVKNVIVIESAVSNNNGMATFDEGPRGEMAHIAETGRLYVKTVTLDNLVESGELPLPDFIKIDIEGAEYDALMGMRILLSRARPVIFLSTHGRGPHQDCCNFLKDMGYRLKPIDDTHLSNAREIMALCPAF
jgi:FkbM family methyltransferase